jgi:hypothetical protein
VGRHRNPDTPEAEYQRRREYYTANKTYIAERLRQKYAENRPAMLAKSAELRRAARKAREVARAARLDAKARQARLDKGQDVHNDWDRFTDAKAFTKHYKESHPCKDCGVSYPYYVMDFDHVGVKRALISRLVTRGATPARIQDEIDQCDLVCANCHRERTHQRKALA